MDIFIAFPIDLFLTSASQECCRISKGPLISYHLKVGGEGGGRGGSVEDFFGRDHWSSRITGMGISHELNEIPKVGISKWHINPYRLGERLFGTLAKT